MAAAMPGFMDYINLYVLTCAHQENAILPAGSDASAYQGSQFRYIHQDRLDKKHDTSSIRRQNIPWEGTMAQWQRAVSAAGSSHARQAFFLIQVPCFGYSAAFAKRRTFKVSFLGVRTLGLKVSGLVLQA